MNIIRHQKDAEKRMDQPTARRGVVARLIALLRRWIPVGYQDDEGFHFGQSC